MKIEVGKDYLDASNHLVSIVYKSKYDESYLGVTAYDNYEVTSWYLENGESLHPYLSSERVLIETA